MKIVVLDGYAENPGDISWAPLEALGELTVYDRTALTESPLIAERISPRVAAAQMALQHTAWRSFDEAVGQLTLALVRENARSTSSPEYFRRIADALSEAYGRPVSLHIENWQEGDGETPSMYRTRKAKENRELAKDLMEQDKAVQDIQKLFDARWIEASIELADAAADTQAA